MLMEMIVPYSGEQYVEPVARCASAAAAICLLLADVAGCGDESGGNPKRELRQWYAGVGQAVAAMERKQRGFTRFRVSEPPEKGAIAKLSRQAPRPAKRPRTR
jgi:hypothetical protein